MSHVRPTLVVAPAASLHDCFGPVKRFGPVYVQTLVGQRPVEGLHEALGRRLAGPAEIETNLVVICPKIVQPIGEFAAVDLEQHLGSTPSAIKRFSATTTRSLPRRCPISIASASRLKTSTIVSARKPSPLTGWSDTKSIAHAWLGCVGMNRLRRSTVKLRRFSRLFYNCNCSRR